MRLTATFFSFATAFLAQPAHGKAAPAAVHLDDRAAYTGRSARLLCGHPPCLYHPSGLDSSNIIVRFRCSIAASEVCGGAPIPYRVRSQTRVLREASALSIENADGHDPGVRNDTAVESVRLVAAAHV